MFGHIASYDPETKSGTIKTGKETFKFDSSIWIADAPPEQDDIVRFDLNSNGITNVNFAGAFIDKANAVKYRWIAATLSFLLGWAGMSRLYLGYYKIAGFQIALTLILFKLALLNFALLWGFIDALLLVAGHADKDAQGRPLK
jgi:hypothetical protein